MKKILIPTDLSVNASNAVRYALSFSKSMPVELVFLHVTHPMLDLPDTSLEFYDPIVFQDEKEQKSYVQKQLDSLFNEMNIATEEIKYSIELRIGFAGDEIAITAKKLGCDLIIMGTQGASGLTKLFLGSVTYSVIKKSEIPVLAIPVGCTFQTPEKIVFATDYEGISNKKTLTPLFDIANGFDSKVLMFHAIESKEPIAAYIEELQVWKAEKNFHHLKHTNSIATCEDVTEGIIEFAEENTADIIAMIPHSYNFIKNLIHKSKTKELAMVSKVPLLVLC
jgi:nucleotide-binding universal stress UspA family protein